MIMLYQIQALKYLGFSLDDIKTRLISLETPEEVIAALTGQENAILEKMQSLNEVLDTIKVLKEEIIQMQTVNFRKYADIIAILQSGNNYWVVKNFSDEMWTHIRKKFDTDGAQDYMDKQNRLFAEVAALKEAGITPDSEQGIEVGRKWYELLMEFSGGDISMLGEMMEMKDDPELWDEQRLSLWEKIEGYLTQALEAYIDKLGYNPFEGMDNEQFPLCAQCVTSTRVLGLSN